MFKLKRLSLSLRAMCFNRRGDTQTITANDLRPRTISFFLALPVNQNVLSHAWCVKMRPPYASISTQTLASSFFLLNLSNRNEA